MRKKRSEKQQKLIHLINAFVILVHAWDKFADDHASWVFFAGFGLIFLLIALFHHKLHHRWPWIDGVFFVIEGLLSLIIAYDYFHMGKKGLPICYLVIGIVQLIVAWVHARVGVAKHRAS